MMKTSAGDFYSPKEILKIMLDSQDYDKTKDWELLQTVFGGLIIRERTEKK